MAKFLPFLRQSTLYIRITLAGERAEISTGQDVDPAKWDSESKRIKGTNAASESINRRITEMVARLRNIETGFIQQGKPYRPADIKAAYECRDTQHRLVEVFAEYVRSLEEEPAATRLAGPTIETYRTRLKNLTGYVATLKAPPLLSQVDEAWLEGYKRHLLKDRGFEVSHAGRQMGVLKTVLDYAVRRKYLPAHPLRDAKILKADYNGREIVYLTEAQMQLLETHPFAGGLREIVDVGIVQARTGMGYAEVAALSWDWIFRGMDKGLWVEFFRRKTRRRKALKVRVPLDDTVVAILERYREHPDCRLSGRCLPVRSNQEYNRQLKALAAAFGLPPDLSTHHFRKTAGMILLNNDVPLETVANILGDTEAVVKTHYARVIEEKTARDMAAYRERMKNKNNNQNNL